MHAGWAAAAILEKPFAAISDARPLSTGADGRIMTKTDREQISFPLTCRYSSNCEYDRFLMEGRTDGS